MDRGGRGISLRPVLAVLLHPAVPPVTRRRFISETGPFHWRRRLMSSHEPVGKFSLGRMVATPNALSRLTHEDVLKALARHAAGDWGDVCPEDWQENELSLREGFRLLSVYRTSTGDK